MTVLTAKQVADALAGGLINEDVEQTIYNLDEGIPTPFTDLCKKDSCSSVYSEWTMEDLNAVDINNAVIDGSNVSGNNNKIGTRVGNRIQLSDKVVEISSIAEALDSVGGTAKMAKQVSKRLMDLRRDKEAIALGRQGSSVDDGSSQPGLTAGFSAWLTTNTDCGAGGSDGGFNTTTKVVDAPVAGTRRALAWETVRNMIEGVYSAGGAADNRLILMSTPAVVKRINSFLLSSAGQAYRAEPTANVSGTSGAAQTAQGYFRYALSDFGIELTIVANRLQQYYGIGGSPYENVGGSPDVDAADVFLIDPKYVGLCYLFGPKVEDLAKQGHADRKLISTAWMTKVYREDAHAVIRDIDPTAAVVAS